VTIRVGIIGAGGIADVHLKNLEQNEQVKLTAICDISQEIVNKKAKAFGMTSYTNPDKMMNDEKLDALFLCVPPFAHGDLEEKAAVRGIHLFIEKPVGLDMSTVRKKAEILKKSKILTSTGYCLRYLDTVVKARNYLANKDIAMVRGYYLTSFVRTPWWREMDKSGGQLVEQTTHTVDLIRYLAGDITKVYANMALRVMNDIEGITIPDVGSVNVVFETGAVGHIDSSFIQPDHRSGLEILGRDFRLAIEGTTLTIVEKEQTIIHNSHTDFYKAQDDAFIDAIVKREADRILCPYEDALKTLEVTLAANESAQTGNPITLGNNRVL
jgi:predicted dehydrogenase